MQLALDLRLRTFHRDETLDQPLTIGLYRALHRSDLFLKPVALCGERGLAAEQITVVAGLPLQERINLFRETGAGVTKKLRHIPQSRRQLLRELGRVAKRQGIVVAVGAVAQLIEARDATAQPGHFSEHQPAQLTG